VGRSRLAAWGAALLTLLGQHRQHPIRLQAGAPDGTGVGAASPARGVRRQQPPSANRWVCPRRQRWRPAGWSAGAAARSAGALLGLALKGALGRLGEADAVERLVFRRLQIEPGGAGGGPATWRWPSTASTRRMRPPLVFAWPESPCGCWREAP
jgi:hypothetical protein